jgi:RNA polymerase primary sigma factor
MRQLKITQSVTNRSEKSVDKYFSDISRIPMITADREIELAQLIRGGDEAALTELVMANLRFVVSVAKQYQNQGMSLPDLINEGNLGLIKAARRFDETRGFKFISYAVWWIRQSILQGVAEHSRLIRIPLNKIGLQNKLAKSIDKLEQELGRYPSQDEIMEFMGVEEKEMNDLMSAISGSKPKSYDASMTSDEGAAPLLDVLINESVESADNVLLTESLDFDVKRALATLTPNESSVIDKFFGLSNRTPMSLDEIGDYMDLTRERVRQIKEKAIRRLRYNGRASILKKYLAQ